MLTNTSNIWQRTVHKKILQLQLPLVHRIIAVTHTLLKPRQLASDLDLAPATMQAPLSLLCSATFLIALTSSLPHNPFNYPDKPACATSNDVVVCNSRTGTQSAREASDQACREVCNDAWCGPKRDYLKPVGSQKTVGTSTGKALHPSSRPSL